MKQQKVRYLEKQASRFRRLRFSRLLGIGPKSSSVRPGSDIGGTRDAPSAGVSELNGFEPVGEAWKSPDPSKPILYMWGVVPLHRDWVARFFPEFRIAFASDEASWAIQKESVDRAMRPSLAVWRKARNLQVVDYASSRGVELLRLTDGFLSWSEKDNGSRRPMSILVDRTGFYFDGTTTSDLERRLLEHDFEADAKLVEKAAMLRKLYVLLQLSRHSQLVLASAAGKLGLQTRRRVLVIGHKRNTRDLLDLARQENPGSEILYVPDAEDARQLGKDPDRLRRLRRTCKVLLDLPVRPDLLSAVDHVYTVSSDHGFDALIYGCKLTVTGAPFYAGWGLTDDRAAFPRRGRKLTLDQLFCGAFLLYPRYIADLEDPVTGCLAAMLHIAADRKQALIRKLTPESVVRKLQPGHYSPHWPLLLRRDAVALLASSHSQELFRRMPDSWTLAGGAMFQRSVAYLILGRLKEFVPLDTALRGIQHHLTPSAFTHILQDLLDICPSDNLRKLWALCCEKAGNTAEARAMLSRLLAAGAPDQVQDRIHPIAEPLQPVALQLAQLELNDRKLDEAERQFNHLLLSGNDSGEVFSGLADIARLRFDFRSAAALMWVCNHLNPVWKGGRGAILEAQMAACAADPGRAAEAYSWACVVNPEYVDVAASGAIASSLNATAGALPYGEAMQRALETTGQGSVTARAKSLIDRQQPEKAEGLLLAYSPNAKNAQRYCLMLSQAYSYQGKLEEAKSLLKAWIPAHPTLPLYHEALRIAVLKNDYAWGMELLQEATDRCIDVADHHSRKILLGVGRIRDSYHTYRNNRLSRLPKTFLGLRYVQTLADLSAGKTATIVSWFGPGDEIRFASFYGEYAKQLMGSSLRITCDPRLHALLLRSHPNVDFVPVGRTRGPLTVANSEPYRELPSSDLHSFVDNQGWKLLQGSDRISMTTDLLGDVIKGYESFSGAAYLKADHRKVMAWAERLRSLRGFPLIGLCWRSSLTTNARNEHYLSVRDLAPVLEVDGIRFVNLQYDECSEELEWIEQNFPRKIVNFPDLDQYNDLDGVAALMANLDLVIAPCTTVLELAGALGRPAFLLSNSSELHWRKRPGTLTDVWHRSVEHVESLVLGDKASLVANLVRRITDFSQQQLNSNQKQAS